MRLVYYLARVDSSLAILRFQKNFPRVNRLLLAATDNDFIEQHLRTFARTPLQLTPMY